MNDQSKLLNLIKNNYPQYLQSEKGRAQLREHLAALERFEQALERIQDQYTGEKAEEISNTLQAVRSSILILEKIDANQKTQKIGESSFALSTPTKKLQTASSKRFLGWLLLIIGILLSFGAYYYLKRERKFRELAKQTELPEEKRDERF